jgi:hypothetical protein
MFNDGCEGCVEQLGRYILFIILVVGGLILLCQVINLLVEVAD